YSLVATSSGQLYSFGGNDYGQLGVSANSGTETPHPTPALVGLPAEAAGSTIASVAAGSDHTLVVTSSGQLYAFGQNAAGELGTSTHNGSFDPNPTPTPVALPGENGHVTELAAGDIFSLALTSSGQLYAFGANDHGQLGHTSDANAH